MAKIFVSLYNFAYHEKDPYIMPPFYEAFINGLKAAGNDILCFFKKEASFFNDKIPSDVLEKVKKFDPDLFIFFNNTFWDITDHFDRPIIVYDVDTVNFFRNKDKIQAKPDRYRYLTFQKESPALICDICKTTEQNIRKVPLFTGVRANPEKTPQNNIAFVGWNWLWVGCDFVTDFVQRDISNEELTMARDVFNTFMNYPFKTTKQIYNEKGYTAQNKLIINNLERCSSLISGVLRARYLCAISDLGLDLRGMSWADDSMKYFPDLCLCYNKEQVFSLSENEAFYNNSKIGFNTNHIQAQSGFSWRVCDIMASNACLVSEYKPGLKTTFPDIPLPTFTTPFEARKQCLKILKENNLRQDIVAASHEVIEKKHRVENVLSEIEDFINMPLHTNVEGRLELWWYQGKEGEERSNKKLSLKNKIRYKIWIHLNKKLSKKGIIKLYQNQEDN